MESLLKLLRLFACHPNLYRTSICVTLVYALPIYILMLVVLLKNRKVEPFDSPFYRQVSLLGFVDILQVIQTYIFLKFPAFGTFSEFYTTHSHVASENCNGEWQTYQKCSGSSEVLPNIAVFLLFLLGDGQYFGITLMSVNRFLAIAFPLSSVHNNVGQMKHCRHSPVSQRS